MDSSTTGQRLLDVLSAYKLKQERDGSFRCNSPLRPGSNSHAFALRIDPDGEHGAYHDHVSNESGSLYDLARLLNIELPRRERAPVASTKRAYTGLADYAKAHGLTPETLTKWTWTEVSYQNRPALAYKTRSGTRWRFLDGKEPFYKSQMGYQRCWYGVTKYLAQWLETYPLVICNGEISVIAAQTIGIAAIAMTGGEHEFPDDLIDELKVFKPSEIVLAFDCDRKGREVARANRDRLSAAGFKVRAIDLGLSDKGDLADFCIVHGKEAFGRLLECADLATASTKPGATRPRRTYVNGDDLINLPGIQWLIPGKLPDKCLTTIFGRSGEGKSFYALRLAYEVGQRFNVLYVAAEGQSGYAQRVEAGKVINQVQTFGRVRFCLGTVSLMDKEDVAAFIEENREYQPRLIIVDTMARSMPGGDENSTRDMNQYIETCNQLMTELDCSTVLVHHIGKSGYVERGSSVLRGACDMMIRITTEDDTTMVECSKVKDGEPFPTEYMKLIQVATSIGTGAWLMPDDKVIKDESALTSTQRTILEALAMDVHTDGCSPSEIEAYAGLSHGSTMRALNTLLKRGLVSKVRTGIYAITENGIGQTTDLDTDPTDLDRSDIALDRVDRADRGQMQPETFERDLRRSTRSARSEREQTDLPTPETDLDTDQADLSSAQLAFIQPPTRYE